MLHRITDRLGRLWPANRFDEVDERVRRLVRALCAEPSPHDDPEYREKFLDALFTSTGHESLGTERHDQADRITPEPFATVAAQWKQALVGHSAPTHLQDAVDSRLAQLLVELARQASASPEVTMSACEVGHEIAYTLKSTPGSYRDMIELLAEFLRTGTTPDPALPPPAWIRVLAEFGEGYATGTRERALTEQNEILSVIATMRSGNRREPLTSAERFQELFTNSPIAMALLDDGGRILEANTALHTLLDQPAEAVHHAALASFARTAQDRVTVESLHRSLSDGQIRGCLPEFRIATDDPEKLVWVRLHWAKPDPGTGHVHVVIEDITEDHVVHQWLYHLANDDPVTDLPNRRNLLDRLDERLADTASPATIGLYAIRLDGLPAIATEFGPTAGATVFNALVARARHAAATTADLIARLDDVTLAVMITDRDSWARAGIMVKRLTRWLAEPVPVGNGAVSITPTVGAAEGVAGRTTAGALVHRLESSLRPTSSASPSWTEDRDGDLYERNRYLARLPAAFEAGEIVLRYAPIARAKTGEVVGSHAIPYWAPPGQQPAPATDLVNLATSIGLSIPIVPWLAGHAAAQAARWQETLGPDAPFIRIDLPEHLAVDENLVDEIRSAVSKHRVRRGILQLGLHESNVLDRRGWPRVGELGGLSGKGIPLVLNGLGASVRHLNLLRDLFLHGVAIAPQLTTEIQPVPRQGKKSVLQAMVELGASLRLEVNLQGVRSAYQNHAVKRFGEVNIEGAAIGKPGPAAELAAMVTNKKSGSRVERAQQ